MSVSKVWLVDSSKQSNIDNTNDLLNWSKNLNSSMPTSTADVSLLIRWQSQMMWLSYNFVVWNGEMWATICVLCVCLPILFSVYISVAAVWRIKFINKSNITNYIALYAHYIIYYISASRYRTTLGVFSGYYNVYVLTFFLQAQLPRRIGLSQSCSLLQRSYGIA